MKSVVNNIQVAVMFMEPLNYDFDFDAISAYIKKNIQLFKGNSPLTIPFNNDSSLPLDFPRFTYQNSNGQLSMSALRIDFLSNSSDIKVINDFINDINFIVNNFSIKNNFRIGIVANCTANKEALFEELKKLIKFDQASDSPEIQFSYLKNELNDDSCFKFNIWRRYFYNVNQSNNSFVIDVNNAAETPLNQTNIEYGKLVISRIEEVLNETFNK